MHYNALHVFSCVFWTPVVSIYVEYNEPELHYTIHEKLSLELYYRIPSHHIHVFHARILSADDDYLLHQHCQSCIPTFGIRIRRLIDNSPLDNIEVSPCNQHLNPPWEPLNIISLYPCKNFDKNNVTHFVFQPLFAAHHAHYNN